MLEVFGLSDAGCVRANNEDSFVIAEDVGLFLVADGMGGAQAGEHASRMASELVSYQIRASESRTADTLVSAIRRANEEVMRAASRNALLEGMGTTIVALLTRPQGGAWVASVGDSRAYVLSGQQMTGITEDQTWVNEVGRKLGLDDESLRVHPMRHVLTMAVGVSNPLRINSYEIDLTPGTQILLCSDGLHGVVSDRVIQAALSDKSLSTEDTCRSLVQAARDAGGPDNITVVLLRAT